MVSNGPGPLVGRLAMGSALGGKAGKVFRLRKGHQLAVKEDYFGFNEAD